MVTYKYDMVALRKATQNNDSILIDVRALNFQNGIMNGKILYLDTTHTHYGERINCLDVASYEHFQNIIINNPKFFEDFSLAENDFASEYDKHKDCPALRYYNGKVYLSLSNDVDVAELVGLIKSEMLPNLPYYRTILAYYSKNNILYPPRMEEIFIKDVMEPRLNLIGAEAGATLNNNATSRFYPVIDTYMDVDDASTYMEYVKTLKK